MTPSRQVMDSSGWIEYFTDGPNADFFAPVIEDPEQLLVPSITILEVFKWVLREKSEQAALQVAALMQQGTLIELDLALALHAARLAVTHKLPLADSIVYAAAEAHEATLWTQDADFEALPGIQYRPKRFP